jgi:hypothetical protein
MVNTPAVAPVRSWWHRAVTILAWLIPVLMSVIALLVATKSNTIAEKAANREVDEVLQVRLVPADLYAQEYETKLYSPRRDEGEPEKILMVTRWPLTISNNGKPAISIIAMNASSRIYGGNRTMMSRLLNYSGQEVLLPLTLDSGTSQRFLVELPISIPLSVYELVKGQAQFTEKAFRPRELEKYLTTHNVDLYGNEARWARKVSAAEPRQLQAHVFTFDADGKLSSKNAQADQVTIRIETARGHSSTATALYYSGQQVPRGAILPNTETGGGRVYFRIDEPDPLPE